MHRFALTLAALFVLVSYGCGSKKEQQAQRNTNDAELPAHLTLTDDERQAFRDSTGPPLDRSSSAADRESSANHESSANRESPAEILKRFSQGKTSHDLKYWTYPEPRRSLAGPRMWRRDHWLVISLERGWTDTGALVLDLNAWPPRFDYWPCGELVAIEPAPQGGWLVISTVPSRRKKKSPPIYAIWHHPPGRPGTSPMTKHTVSPSGGLRGIVIVDKQVFTYDDKVLYRWQDHQLAETTIPQPVGKKLEELHLFTHGQIRLADDKRLLVWDGNAYAFENGRFAKRWALGIDNAFEFKAVTLPEDGTYFLERRKVFKVAPDGTRVQVMAKVKNVWHINPGPDGSLLFSTAGLSNGISGGLWRPQDDKILTLPLDHFHPELSRLDMGSDHWSAATGRLYMVRSFGLYTIPYTSFLAQTGSE